MSSKDYSLYIRDKKTQVSQTGFANISTNKFRSPYSYFNYFPLYKGLTIVTPNNKFQSPNFTFFTLLDGLLSNNPTSVTYDGVDNIYIGYLNTGTGSDGLGVYSITNNTLNLFFINNNITSISSVEFDRVRSRIYIGSRTTSKMYYITDLTTTSTTKTLTQLTDINSPAQFAFDGNDKLYTVDDTNHVIYVTNLTSIQITVFAGFFGVSGSADGSKTSTARFNSPNGIVCDGTNTIYVSDSGNNAIRKIDVGTSNVTTISGGSQGFLDGIGTNARFNNPIGLTINTFDKILYITDRGNNRIRALNLNTNAVTTVAGNGLVGNYSRVNGGYPLEASFGSNLTNCIYVSPYLYILDTGNKSLHRVIL
jgi:hypothetical protein